MHDGAYENLISVFTFGPAFPLQLQTFESFDQVRKSASPSTARIDRHFDIIDRRQLPSGSVLIAALTPNPTVLETIHDANPCT